MSLKSREIKLPRIIPPRLSEEQAKYIYTNRKGKVIFLPLYNEYKNVFLDPIIQHTDLVSTFEKFEPTGIYERYMTNAAQFAAAKQVSENELLAKAAIMKGSEDNLRPYKEYKELAQQITTTSRETWLRVEYDSNRANAIGGAQYARMVQDKDIYPYWRYKGVMDSRERPEHRAMEGLVFRIGDPAGDACWPVNDWNCRCVGVAEDGSYLYEINAKALTNDQAQKYLENNVAPEFRFNPAIQGTLPNDHHSYFEAMGSANEGNFSLFDLPPARHMGFGDRNLEGLAATGLHRMINIVDEWRDNHHIGKAGTIIFQNKDLYTNVIWTSKSLHNVHQHQRGFENIPDTITAPDEVWASWADAESQLVSNRTYIKFGKVAYLVFTEDGTITDAKAVSPIACDKYRKGVIL